MFSTKTAQFYFTEVRAHSSTAAHGSTAAAGKQNQKLVNNCRQHKSSSLFHWQYETAKLHNTKLHNGIHIATMTKSLFSV